MNKLTVLFATLILSIAAFAENRVIEGPLYDAGGHLVAYTYADGTRDTYAYDTAGRMTRFVDRHGAETKFVHDSKGSMATSYPDGSKR